EQQRLLDELSEAERERDDNAEILQGEVAASSELRADLKESSEGLATARAEVSELARKLEETERERQRLAEAEQALTEAQDLSTVRIAELVEESESMRAFFELVRQRTMPGPETEHFTDQIGGSQTASAVEPETEPETGAAAEPDAAPEAGRSLLTFVENWASAWSEQRVDDYLGCYSNSFRTSAGLSLVDWRNHRRERVASPEWIEVKVAILDVRNATSDRAEVEVMQSYSSDRLNDTVIKTLELVREDGLWKIAAESIE
ncbi:MAG: hypothetical protein OES47_02755, partial [Acidobacteriota bacterium]|nr:hypothetical protein [Acidobacteriota bacterium]